MLPNPQVLAIRAHKRIETELIDLYFRENPIVGLEKDLCKRIQINYDSASANVDESTDDAAPTSRAADVEAPAE